MKLAPQRYIAIEGCIGVGKTTLARKLSKFRKARILLEDFRKNPFLPEFYDNPTSNVLENSLQFLLMHCYQIRQIKKLPNLETITDFSFSKDRIFAEINLSDQTEQKLFEEMCNLLHAKLPEPDLVIYIRGSNPLIIKRIRHRNRTIESGTNASYFEKINGAYERFFSGYTGPLHIIKADLFDCVKDSKFVANLSKEIDLFFTR